MLCAVCSYGYSQTVDSLRLKLDDIFLNVDKSQIPNGYIRLKAENKNCITTKSDAAQMHAFLIPPLAKM